MIRSRLHVPMLKRRNELAKVNALLTQNHRLGKVEGLEEGRRRERNEYRRQYERTIALPKSDPYTQRGITIGEEPQTRGHRIVIHGSPRDSFEHDPRALYSTKSEEFVFRAVRQSHQLHTGHVVHWWTWTLDR
jgi:hypothetical protein